MLTQKAADYALFKQGFEIISNKNHLTIEGIEKLVSIKASMNLGLQDELKKDFSKLKSIERPLVADPVIRNPNWISGFIDGEGCFFIEVQEANNKVSLKFLVTQHSRDKVLLESIKNYFCVGRIETNIETSVCTM